MEIASRVKLDFNNTEIAFRGKSDGDLNKAYWLFKMIGNNALIKIGTPVANFALRIGLPIQGIIRKTIYRQFCGGENIEGCRKAIDELARGRVTTILDYSVEGENCEQSFDATCAEIMRTIEAGKNTECISFSVFKLSGIGRFELLAKIDAKEPLSTEEKEEYQRLYERCDRICQASYEADIPVSIDAEHSWTQETVDDIAREMMEKYNIQKPIVYNTYQLYRHDKLASMKADLAYAKTQGFHLGAKIVRGAYMELERDRAKKMGYPSPIQPDKEATDTDFNQAIHFALDHLDSLGLMAGTHNEESCRLLADELDRRGIAHNDPHVHFAQLLGMSDNLSFNLAAAGYNVAKYMPYGPVDAVLPYLFRRAQENTSVEGQTGRELTLITNELDRRRSKKK
ncbi:MAG: proline dehydrogenase family protein [Sphingobacterium sp.]